MSRVQPGRLYDDLDHESLLALIYEDYCLRQEAGESPTAAEYQARFPELARSFQEVIEIHDLVGRAGDRSWRLPRDNEPPFPLAGQTIAGFRLVEELGRGAFARVFLAEEQHLADRPVALKVSRSGSHEPQTLARLQHTHIVPVYSTRADPLTGLHLLCMPYLGRVTLLQVLQHPAIRSARTGRDILSILDGLEAPLGNTQDASSRAALSNLSYARAIAWWGARMAEALAHAHERGVLHRDVKPSNVLVTTDGLPMLLDFNLAREIKFSDPDAEVTVGGTLGYMAPERLLALAEGRSDHVDARCDIYALGVVLFDCLVRATGAFALPSTRSTLAESLLTSVQARQVMPVRLRLQHPDVPAAFEAVVNRCLAPEPADRYQSAAELAVDLQAVADDAPLQIAREPMPSRLMKWLRRNHRRLAVAVPLLLALLTTAYTLFRAQVATIHRQAEVRHEIDEARHAADDGRLEVAQSRFETAERLAEGHRELREARQSARDQGRTVRERIEIRDRADALFADGDRLRFLLLFGSDPREAYESVRIALAKFSIPTAHKWESQPALRLLDGARRTRLVSEANELLFLWAWALLRNEPDNPSAAAQVSQLCDSAGESAAPLGPWQALRSRSAAILAGYGRRRRELSLPATESSARGCFEWALLCELEAEAAGALAWLERGNTLEENNYWSLMYLGYYHQKSGQESRALQDYTAAVALRPGLPWARYDRALIYRSLGDWNLALGDLSRASESPEGAKFLDLRLTLGAVKQVLGDEGGARAAYEGVIAAKPGGNLLRAARINLASLDCDTGFPDRAWSEYNSLLDDNPRDAQARLDRSVLAVRSGRFQQADQDLTVLLQIAPEQAEKVLARRASARMALGKSELAADDAAGAYRRKATPSRERLWVRTLLALHRAEELTRLTEPDDLALLPAAGPTLQADLRKTAERLLSLSRTGQPGPPPSLVARTRAVLLSALDDRAALKEANRAIALSPESAEAHLVKARVSRRLGDRQTAFADVEAGLALAPNDVRLLELRGVLKTETGNPEAGLIDLDRAIVQGAPVRSRASRARTFLTLDRNDRAEREWTAVLDNDPEDPQAYLGRAMARLRLGLYDAAWVDLRQALDWGGDNPLLLSQITIAHAACIGSRPDRLAHWLALAERTWPLWLCASPKREARQSNPPAGPIGTH